MRGRAGSKGLKMKVKTSLAFSTCSWVKIPYFTEFGVEFLTILCTTEAASVIRRPLMGVWLVAPAMSRASFNTDRLGSSEKKSPYKDFLSFVYSVAPNDGAIPSPTYATNLLAAGLSVYRWI